jgi:hypothetical protein
MTLNNLWGTNFLFSSFGCFSFFLLGTGTEAVKTSYIYIYIWRKILGMAAVAEFNPNVLRYATVELLPTLSHSRVMLVACFFFFH